MTYSYVNVTLQHYNISIQPFFSFLEFITPHILTQTDDALEKAIALIKEKNKNART